MWAPGVSDLNEEITEHHREKTGGELGVSGAASAPAGGGVGRRADPKNGSPWGLPSPRWWRRRPTWPAAVGGVGRQRTDGLAVKMEGARGAHRPRERVEPVGVAGEGSRRCSDCGRRR